MRLPLRLLRKVPLKKPVSTFTTGRSLLQNTNVDKTTYTEAKQIDFISNIEPVNFCNAHKLLTTK